MKTNEIYTDYMNVFKIICNNEVALSAVESKYGKMNTLGDLLKLGQSLYEQLSEDEKNMVYAQSVLAMEFADESKYKNQN